MSLLQWDDAFETGIPAADHEHGKLVDLVNTVYERWQRKGHPYPSELFDDLFRIFMSHFEFEDRIMSEIDYPEREAHGRDHFSFYTLLGGYHRSGPARFWYAGPIVHTDSVQSRFSMLFPLWFSHTDKATETNTTVIPPLLHVSRGNPESGLSTTASGE